MNKYNLTILVLLILISSACRKKEVFPDLAKEVEGKWIVYDATLMHQLTDSVNHYNPKDSAQIGQIIVQKIDPLRVKVSMLMKKRSGQIFYENSFESELSRDIENAGFILFHTKPGNAANYNSNTGIFSVYGVGKNKEESTGVTAWFEAKR